MRLKTFGVDFEIVLSGFLLQVSGVPQGEFIFVDLRQVVVEVTQGVVGPSLGHVEVLDEGAWVSTPKLLRWDQSAWWHYGAWGQLGSGLDPSALEHDTLVADDNIVSDMARVESAVGTDSGISSDVQLGLHTAGQRWRGMKH